MSVTTACSTPGYRAPSRNDRPESAEETTLVAALQEMAGGRDKVEAYRRVVDAAHQGSLCGQCGRQLAPGEPAHRRRYRHASPFGGTAYLLMPTCSTCCGWCRDPRWESSRHECQACGRVMLHWFRFGPRIRRMAVCSDRCRWAVNREHRRRSADPTACAVCGERIDATRRDARYCSSACRQRAYRARRAP